MSENTDRKDRRRKLILSVFRTPDGRKLVEETCEMYRPVFCESQRLQDFQMGEQAPWLEIRALINDTEE